MKKFVTACYIILLLLNCGQSEYEQAKEIYRRTTFQKNYTNNSSSLEDAIIKLKSVLNQDPDDLNAKILLWKCYIKTDDPQQQRLREQLLNQKQQLLSVLKKQLDDRDELVRQLIVTLIGDLENSDSVPILIDILEKDEYQNVQRAAAEALTKSKDKRAIPPLLSKLDSSYPLVRLYAVSALADFDEPHVIEKLLATLTNADETIDVRHQTALAIGKIGNKLAEPELLNIFQSPEQPVESILLAATALGMLDNPAGFDFAMELAKSDDPYLVGLALTALGYISNSKALPILIEYLSYGNKAQRTIAAEALGNIGDNKAIPALKQATSDPISSVAETAKKSLLKLQTRQPDQTITGKQ